MEPDGAAGVDRPTPSADSVSMIRIRHFLPSAIAARPELPLVAAFGVIAAVAAGVLKLASEVSEGETEAVDRAILVWLRAAVHGSRHETLIDRTMLDITALGGGTTLTLVIVIAAGLLISLRRYVTAAVLVVQVIAGTSLVAAAKLFFDRTRPDVVPHLASFTNASFPSGHAANSAIVYLSIAVLLATAAPTRPARGYIIAAAALLTMVIGFSRLYLGVHWPSDVIAGWAIGAGWALAVGLLARWLRRHDTPL